MTPMLILKRKSATSSRFSEFIRNAPAREKKKVYEQVLKRASERQRRLLEESNKDSNG